MPRLLAISNWVHDYNLCYFDGSVLHYYKPERYLQIKHYPNRQAASNYWIADYLNREHGITIADIDDVQYVGQNNLSHHWAHALSAEMFCPTSPITSFVIDGRGGSVTWAVFKNDCEIAKGDLFANGSIGQGMTILGWKLGIKGERLDIAGKLMGLQSYGNIDYEYLETLQSNDMYSIGARIEDEAGCLNKDGLFSFERWSSFKGSIAEKTKLDWARTVHHRCGEILLDFFQQHSHPDEEISYTGGCAQNVIWNTLLKNHFKNLTIVPHCGDEGLSFGAMELLRRKHLLPPFDFSKYPFMQSDESPRNTIDEKNTARVAQLLARGKVVAWYQGHGEIGPRALGNRSILMDPRIKNGREIINQIKRREKYRPFGGSVLSEYAQEYFGLAFDNPYMLYVGKTLQPNLESITHVDRTCRVQTVKDPSPFRFLLETFHKLTGCPVLLNTSLNISGKPIAGMLKDAIEEFNSNPIDVLVIGNEIWEKKQ